MCAAQCGPRAVRHVRRADITTYGNDIVLAASTTWRLAAAAMAAATTAAGLNVFAAIPCGGAGNAALHARWWALEAAPELLYAALREAGPKVGVVPCAPTPAAPTSESALSPAPVPRTTGAEPAAVRVLVSLCACMCSLLHQ